MATVLITGGTGMIGTALTQALFNKGYQVIILTRKAKPPANNIIYKEWDVENGTMDTTAICGADYIVHLAGANVGDKRWTEKRKQEIVDSRVKSGRLLVNALQNTPNNIKAVVSASAIGWYGPDPKNPDPEPFTETAPHYNDFLGNTSAKWEDAVKPVNDLGKRLVTLRTGIVLSNEGGAYPEFKKPLKFGVAAILGSGRQTISWIHIDDMVRLYMHAIDNEHMQGIYNAVAPTPVSNEVLTRTIAKEKKRFYMPVHVPVLALKTVLGEMSIEVLKSTTVSANKILAAGFVFSYPAIHDAVKELENKV